jgi:hypothetical protein
MSMELVKRQIDFERGYRFVKPLLRLNHQRFGPSVIRIALDFVGEEFMCSQLSMMEYGLASRGEYERQLCLIRCTSAKNVNVGLTPLFTCRFSAASCDASL